MFSQMVEEEQRKYMQLNKGNKQQMINPEQKYKSLNQKLMVYEVITSRQKIITQLSPEANKISKRVLGVNVNAVNGDPNSNLRAYSYLLLHILTQQNQTLHTSSQIHQKLSILKQNPPKINNYPSFRNFSQQQMLQFFTLMQQKISQLIQCKLTIAQIIKFYNGYLDIITYFLRSLLTFLKMFQSNNWITRLKTSQVYSILSDYLDLQLVCNQNVYLFPEVKVFIGVVEEREFVFGKYYENVEELRKNQAQIRQSTMDHIVNTNEKYDNMRISNIVVDISMSQCMFPDKLADIQAPFSSKAPTPQFGQNQYKGFEQLLGYNSQEEALRQNNGKGQINQRQTKPGSIPNFALQSQTQIEGEVLKNTIKLQRESVFTRKTLNDEIMTPTENARNNIGSAFCLHQFDFYRKINQQFDADDKFLSQRVLLKGSSMVDQGKNFLQQVGELKKEIQNQLFDKNKQKRRFKQTDLHQSIQANVMNQDFQRKSRNHSPKSINARSQGVYEKKSCHSGYSKKSNNKMALASDVYQIKIQTRQGTKPIKGPTYQNSRSTSKTKFTTNIKVIPSTLSYPSFGKQFLNPNITINASSKPQFPKMQTNYHKPSAFRASQVPQISTPSHLGYKQNHIHIHIHNQNNLIDEGKKNTDIVAGSPKNKQIKKTENAIHYNVTDQNIQSALQHAIPKILQQLETKKIEKSNNLGSSMRTQMRTQVKNFKEVLNYKEQTQGNKSPLHTFMGTHSMNINKKNNAESQLLIKKQPQFKLKKRKSEDVFQTIISQLSKQQNMMMSPDNRRYVHVPSFIRNKQKMKTQNDQQRLEKSMKRQHSKSKKIITHITKKEPNCRNPSSPKAIFKQHDRLNNQLKKFGQKMHLNIKSGNYLAEPKYDLKTPTFGTPQQAKNKEKLGYRK